MRSLTRFAFLTSVLLLSSGAVQQGEQPTAGPQVSDEAPDFELRDHEGTTYRLSDFRDEKNVVLEFIRSGGW